MIRKNSSTIAVAISLLAILISILMLTGCGTESNQRSEGDSGNQVDFRLLASSENKSLDKMIKNFATEYSKKNSIEVRISSEYMGSLEVRDQIRADDVSADAVFVALPFWIDQGEEGKTQKVVKHKTSIWRSPIIYSLKKPIAQRLGWTSRSIKTMDYLTKAEAGEYSYGMTSCFHSNSGFCALIGITSAFSGNSGTLSSAAINEPALQGKVSRFLQTVDHTTKSSSALKDAVVNNYLVYDGMINYECLVIEANQELVKQGKDPLYALYPSDGLAVADATLAYVDHGDKEKEKFFFALQEFLTSKDAQKQIELTGRRTGSAMTVQFPNPRVFSADWGIKSTNLFTPITIPESAVVNELMSMYQSKLRKPSVTAYVLDFSGSMLDPVDSGDSSSTQKSLLMKNGMSGLLDQTTARAQGLGATERDIVIVVTFNQKVTNIWQARGTQKDLTLLARKINAEKPDGGTEIFGSTIAAYQTIASIPNLDQYAPMVVLMTDGESNQSYTLNDLSKFLKKNPRLRHIPTHTIPFGSDAKVEQLQGVADLTQGKALDRTQDLSYSLMDITGNNR